MNSLGRYFRLSIWGESHGPAVGVVIDGCPPGIALKPADFSLDLDRRRSGAPGTTGRREPDRPVLKSGVRNGRATGTPLLIEFPNLDARPADYENTRDIPRPGHADWAASVKYGGFNDLSGGGHFSGRLTVGLVAAGVVAKKIIRPINVRSDIVEIGGRKNFQRLVRLARENGDSLGGIVECRAENVPPGLGEPFFDSVESLLAHAVFSIPAVKGIEFGAGFQAARMEGSEFNDPIIDRSGRTGTNHAGGINGGITNGNTIVFRVAVRPTPSISLPQRTIDLAENRLVNLRLEGRHDACVALRVPVILEAVTAVVLADLVLLKKAGAPFRAGKKAESKPGGTPS